MRPADLLRRTRASAAVTGSGAATGSTADGTADGAADGAAARGRGAGALDRLLVPLAVVVALVRVGLVALAPYDRAAGLFDDDAFYYFGIARRIAAGDGSTFNGLDPTNGYHPLWQLALTPVFAVFDGRAALVAVTVLTGALLVVSAVLLRLLRVPVLVAAVPLLVAGAAGPSFWFSGMETGLLLTTLLAVAVVVTRGVTSARGALGLGVLLGVTVLSRLDAIFPMALLGLVLAWRWRRRPSWITAVAVPPAALLGGYVLVNRALFDTALPVSGQAKAVGGGGSLNLDVARQFLAAPTVFGVSLWLGLVALVVVPAAVVVARRAPVDPVDPADPVDPPDPADLADPARPAGVAATADPAAPADPAGTAVARAAEFGLVVLAGGASTVAYYAVTSSWQLWPWYFYAAPLSLALALPALAARLPLPARAWRAAGALAVVVVLATVALQAARVARGGVARAAFVEAGPAVGAQLDALPGDAPFAMGDRAGSVGFHTTRPMVHLEGLVNSVEYLDALRDGGVARFLAARGVDWYARGDAAAGEPRPDGCRAFTEPTQGGGAKSTIVVCDADLAFEHPLADGTSYRVWRYRPDLNP